ncbi:hypothetical protein MVEN_00795200 [Mycena venus]|uniref:Uncharacterized protein n=1 Tax=Mycena venus TaxID=2733690 RepID=A0A8H6YMJ8_9AGAR|nr:hypothetical protein MVEN_00795200 [Mycena venus]
MPLRQRLRKFLRKAHLKTGPKANPVNAGTDSLAHTASGWTSSNLSSDSITLRSASRPPSSTGTNLSSSSDARRHDNPGDHSAHMDHNSTSEVDRTGEIAQFLIQTSFTDVGCEASSSFNTSKTTEPESDGPAPTTPGSPAIDSDGNIINRTINHVSILNVAGNRNENHFYSAPPVDATLPVPLPEDFRKHIESSPRLRSILGVSIVFHDPSSVLQISRVLKLHWTDVSAALKPILNYLDGLDSDTISYNSDIKLRQPLRDSLLRKVGTVWLDAAKYHALVAEWCLVGESRDARDIIYAGDFWDHHVCNASASTELYDTLKRSRLPLDPVSRPKLPAVIYWIEENGGTGAPGTATDLVLAYREHVRRPQQQVRVMGGMLSLSF